MRSAGVASWATSAWTICARSSFLASVHLPNTSMPAIRWLAGLVASFTISMTAGSTPSWRWAHAARTTRAWSWPNSQGLVISLVTCTFLTLSNNFSVVVIA